MSDTAQKIQQLLKPMEALGPERGDVEVQHWDADGLLIDVLHLLADDGVYPEELRKLCDLWQVVPKWYA